MCSKFLKPECYKNDEFDKFKDPSMILPNNNIEIGNTTRSILISCKNDANYNTFMNIIIFFYQKVVEDSLKRLPMHTLYKEFRFVDPKIVLTKSNITLDCTIKSLNYVNKKEVILNELGQIKITFQILRKLNYLLICCSFGITCMSLKILMIVSFLRT